jgi:hypothetical protein
VECMGSLHCIVLNEVGRSGMHGIIALYCTELDCEEWTASELYQW